MDALRLGDQPESMAIAVEAPGPTFLGDFKAGLIVPVQEFVRDLAGWILVGQFDRLGAKPLHAHHRDHASRKHAADGGLRLEILKRGHAKLHFPE
jgi:hypothetical protein